MKEGNYDDYTVLFMTDGQDTRDPIIRKMNEMMQQVNQRKYTMRIFALGFSRYHDAALLGQFAAAGNDLGNFVYIDETAPKWQQ